MRKALLRRFRSRVVCSLFAAALPEHLHLVRTVVVITTSGLLGALASPED